MSVAAQDWIGLTLCERYAIKAKLGEGGMGAVLRARDRRLGTDVVIKVPRRELLGSREFIERFKEEIRALVRLTHPHVVKVTDADVHDGVPFAVLQFLAGGSLESKRRPRGDGFAPVDPASLESWLPQVAAALDFLHSQNYVHRDVKPANILFDEHGNAYLGDFGVVKALAAHEEGCRGQTLTGTGLVLGTPQYMSPELIMGQPFDGRSDQYALAVVVFEMLCGRRPFEADAPSAILVLHTTKAPPPPSSLAPGISADVSKALLRGLAKKPAQRYATCEEFTKAILAAVHGRPTASEPSAPPAAALVSRGPAGQVPCPGCRQVLPLKPRHAGRLISCPHCRAALRVGGKLNELTIDAQATTKLAEQSAPLVHNTGGMGSLPTPSHASAGVRLPTHKVDRQPAPTQVHPLVWATAGLAVGVLALAAALLLWPSVLPETPAINVPPPPAPVPKVPPDATAPTPQPDNLRPATEDAGEPEPRATEPLSGKDQDFQEKPSTAALSGDETERESENTATERPQPEAVKPDAPAAIASPDSAQEGDPVGQPVGVEDRPAAPSLRDAQASPRDLILASGRLRLASGETLAIDGFREKVNADQLRSAATNEIPRVEGPVGVLRLDDAGFVEFRGVNMHGRAVFLSDHRPALAMSFKEDKRHGPFLQVDDHGERVLAGEYREGRPAGVWCYFDGGKPCLVQQFKGRTKSMHVVLADKVAENVDLDAPPREDIDRQEWLSIASLRDVTLDRHNKIIDAADRLFKKEAAEWYREWKQALEKAKKERRAAQQEEGNRRSAPIQKRLNDALRGQ